MTTTASGMRGSTRRVGCRFEKKTFAKGLRFCNELDGKNFYFSARDRVLNLDDYSTITAAHSTRA